MVFLITAFIVAILLRQKKIVIMQAVSCLLLLTFLAVIFGSTVFTRTPGVRQYQLEVIEVSRLVLCRGLFEFDDIIHNSLGCMLGILFGDKVCKY